MRQQHNNNNNSNNRNRTRGRGRKTGNSMNRSFESNGPDVKIRGNAGHIAEKYLNLARDALTSGDPVMAENYYQHAEHYNRIVALAQANNPQQQVKSGDDNRNNSGSGPQPEVDGVPVEVALSEDSDAEVASEDNSSSSNNQRSRGNGASKPKQEASESDAEEANSDVSSEEEAEAVEAKPRSRNRRPRARKGDNISDDAAKLPGNLTAAPDDAEDEAVPVIAED